MRSLILLVCLALASIATLPAAAQVSFGFSAPGVSIGINVPAYPRLVPVPGYPVYYAPGLRANYFFYDGLYWIFQDGNWYESTWYNGPWYLVSPDAVPLYVLRVPVRYYRAPPPFFYGWAVNEPPHWHEHWGHEWAERHRGWEHWDHGRVPRAAPLPSYQQRFSGERYPHVVEDQARLAQRNYRYQPRDQAVRPRYEQHAVPAQGQRYHEQRAMPAQPQRYHEQRAMPAQPQRYEQRGAPAQPQYHDQRAAPAQAQRQEQRAAPAQQRHEQGRPEHPEAHPDR